MKKVLIITGANGFLGNNIIRLVDKDKYEVRALYHSNSKVLDSLDCIKIEGNILDINSLDKLFYDLNNREVIVIHAAAKIYIGNKYDKSTYDINVNGTKNIVSKCLEYKARLIYINSVHSILVNSNLLSEIDDYNPDLLDDLYAKTKAIGASYVLSMVKEKNLDAVIIQPSSMIGPNNYSKDYLIEMIKMVASKKLRFSLKGGYDFVDVRDVANGIISSIDKGRCGNSYILSGNYVTVHDLLNLVARTCSIKPIKYKIPLFLIYISLPFVSLYYKITKKIPLFSKNSIKILQENIRFSNDKARRELNYQVRDIKDTISDTIKWLKDNKMI